MSFTQLKILAVVLMVIDHIGYFFPSYTSITFRIIGRISAPIFIYLFSIGYFKSKNKDRIKKNILMGTFLMTIINFIFIYGLGISSIKVFMPNMFLSYFLSILTLEISVSSNSKKIKTLKIFILLTISTFVEYSILSVLLPLIFVYFQENKLSMINLYITISIIYSLMFNNWVQLFMIFSIIFIVLHNKNAKNNRKKRFKNFFYYFYPIHIYILMLLSNILYK